MKGFRCIKAISRMCYTVYSKLVYFVSFTVNVYLGILSSEGMASPFDSLSIGRNRLFHRNVAFQDTLERLRFGISIANFYCGSDSNTFHDTRLYR